MQKNPLKQYLLAKSVYFYGIPTTIISFIIYIFLQTKPEYVFSELNLINDFMISIFVTIFICTVSCIPGIRADMKKGTAPDASGLGKESKLYKLLPMNLVLQSLIFAILGALVFALLPLLLQVLGVVLTTWAFRAFLAIYAGIYIALTIRLAVAAALCKGLPAAKEKKN